MSLQAPIKLQKLQQACIRSQGCKRDHRTPTSQAKAWYEHGPDDRWRCEAAGFRERKMGSKSAVRRGLSGRLGE